MVNSAKKSSRSISPSSPQFGDHPPHFALDRRGVALHVLAAQRGVVQHLLAPLRAGVEHHTLAEDRRHEGIRLGLVEILVGGTEEELVGFGAGQQDDVLVGQLEPAHVPALVAGPLHQRRSDRCGIPRDDRALLRRRKPAARQQLLIDSASPLRQVRVLDVPSCVGQRRLGLDFHVHDEADPRGVSATNVIARARSAGRRK